MSDEIVSDNTPLTLSSPLTSGSFITFANSPSIAGTLVLAPTAFEPVTLINGGNTLVSATIGGPIEGFVQGDTIDLLNLGADAAGISPSLNIILEAESLTGTTDLITLTNGVLSDTLGLLSGQGVTVIPGLLTLSLPLSLGSNLGSFVTTLGNELLGPALGTNALTLGITPDMATVGVADGILTTNALIALCFLRGTRLLTPTGIRAIEDLKIGDPLVTRFGGIRPIKWIGRQSYAPGFIANNTDKIPVCIKAGALAPHVPAEDLYVSPGHALLIGGNLITAKNLINGVTITQTLPAEAVHYYHVEFDSHDCVIANGTWAESYADAPEQRAQYANAAEFAALYPDYVTPDTTQLCAPRPAHRRALADALRPIIARAMDIITPGPTRGYVEEISATGRLAGWAQDMAHQALPVLLDVYLRDTLIAQLTACDPRADLAEAGIGNGQHGFAATLPALAGQPPYDIRVIVQATGTPLPLSHACAQRLGLLPAQALCA